jgi:hypothetical protein
VAGDPTRRQQMTWPLGEMGGDEMGGDEMGGDRALHYTMWREIDEDRTKRRLFRVVFIEI